MSSTGVPAVAVGVAYPARRSQALSWAAREAVLRSAPLRLITGWAGTTHNTPAELSEDLLKSGARSLLQEVALDIEAEHPGLLITCEVLDIDARKALEQLSDEVQLLVVGAHRSPGAPERLLRSTSLHAAMAGHCPVVIVPEGPYAGAATRGSAPVLFGVNGHDPGGSALTFAFETAARENAPLRVVHASPPGLTRSPVKDKPHAGNAHVLAERNMDLHRMLAPWQARFPDVELHPETLRADAAHYLTRRSQKARLVVLGRGGHPTGALGRLSAVGLDVVQHAGCPIAVVPAS